MNLWTLLFSASDVNFSCVSDTTLPSTIQENNESVNGSESQSNWEISTYNSKQNTNFMTDQFSRTASESSYKF